MKSSRTSNGTKGAATKTKSSQNTVVKSYLRRKTEDFLLSHHAAICLCVLPITRPPESLMKLGRKIPHRLIARRFPPEETTDNDIAALEEKSFSVFFAAAFSQPHM